MGGGKGKCDCNQNICQMCDKDGHIASQCPWVYKQCSKQNCYGLMMMNISEQEETLGQKFLKCQYQSCGTWKWLEDAICEVKVKKAHGESGSTSHSCFICGQNGHWVKNCPWRDSGCPYCCEGARKVLTSKQERSYGQKFLKCVKCGSFEWLEHAMEKASKNNIRAKIKVNLDDLCNTYEKKMKFP